MSEISKIIERHNEFFKSNKTLDVKFRLKYLKLLYTAIKNNLTELHEGLKLDLGKSENESFMCETGLALSELTHTIKHLKKYVKPQIVKTPIAQFPSKSYRIPCPYGVVLIMNPWNYPFLLSITPLIEAIAAGNTVILKLSAYSPNVNKAIIKTLESVFESGYVDVVCGNSAVISELLEQKFDYIFFTGSKRVGQIVYEKAAKNLTPVSLELGGKSPCIIDETADVPLAARRIVWGKYLNHGQTCVAPDYVLCHKTIREQLIAEIKKQIDLQFSANPLENENYGKVINKKHFDRLIGLLDMQKVVHGGRSDEERLKIEPTVLDNVNCDDAVMQEEIFGPILPIMTYEKEEEIISFVSSNPAPLALYVFSKDKKRIDRLTTRLSFGGGCINDVVIHIASSNLPFGGFKDSGIGAYHGKAGFDTFTHYKSIVNKSTLIDLPMRYQPYKEAYQKLIRKVMR
ncbi:MAG: aldehyde dehydrogenase [Clostridia bacterium]|nr:aldehyde dehydrogenase [Clostridia bacterium]MDE7328425.1 aldehyde dehydrogenase [Clostridia bacterium]